MATQCGSFSGFFMTVKAIPAIRYCYFLWGYHFINGAVFHWRKKLVVFHGHDCRRGDRVDPKIVVLEKIPWSNHSQIARWCPVVWCFYAPWSIWIIVDNYMDRSTVNQSDWSHSPTSLTMWHLDIFQWRCSSASQGEPGSRTSSWRINVWHKRKHRRRDLERKDTVTPWVTVTPLVDL